MDRPVRVGALLFLLVLTLLGSLQGAGILWVRAGWPGGFTVVTPSTHGMVQVGAFFLLILGFLTHVVPGMTGQRGEIAGVRLPLLGMTLGLAAATLAELAVLPQWVHVVARAGLLLALVAAVTAVGRTVVRGKVPRGQPGFPWLLLGVMGFVVCSAAWLAEAAGMLTRAVAATLALPTTVTMVILGMGYRMFTAMLHLGPPRAAWFVGGSVLWWTGGVVNAVWHPTLPADAAMLSGALLMLLALGFHRRRNALQAGMMRAPTFQVLRLQVGTGAVMLVLSPAVGIVGAVLELPALRDLSRHMLAMGFCLNVTMAITQHVLPRMTAGRMCSPRVMTTSWGLLAAGLLLRTVGTLDPLRPWMAFSGVVSMLAVGVYAAHLGQAIWRPLHLQGASAAG